MCSLGVVVVVVVVAVAAGRIGALRRVVGVEEQSAASLWQCDRPLSSTISASIALPLHLRPCFLVHSIYSCK